MTVRLIPLALVLLGCASVQEKSVEPKPTKAPTSDGSAQQRGLQPQAAKEEPAPSNFDGLAVMTANSITGPVYEIVDGDTFKFRVRLPEEKGGMASLKVRFGGIDCLEKAQPGGFRAKLVLTELIYGKEVQFQYYKFDKRDRPIGKAILDGRDISIDMLDSGLCFVYRKYLSEQAPRERELYLKTEERAKRAQKGAWGFKRFVFPWEYRNSKRSKRRN